MKLNFKRNSKRNMIIGLVFRVVSTVLPFLVQTVFIRRLGTEYVGIRGLFTSILSVFSLAELGLGSTIVFSMYKPIAEDNTKELCALLNLYKKTYRMIGLIILLLSLLILPFLPRLIHGSIPAGLDLNVVFLLFTAQTVFSYWFFAYNASLLQAYQRIDVISTVGLFTAALSSAAQIAILFMTNNFYLFQTVSVILVILNNILVSNAAVRMFPHIKCRGSVSFEKIKDLKKKVAGAFIGKICGTTRNTFDTIFISAFISLTQSGIYTNYFYVITALNGFTEVFTRSLLAGVGNRIVLESKDKNYEDMMRINRIYLVLCGWASIAMLCLFQPFMTLWAGKENLFSEPIMMLFPVYFYVQKMGDVRGIYSDAAGLFWENRWRTVAEAVANIILNYIFVIWLGVFGVILATIITLFFIGFLGSSVVLFKHYYTYGFMSYLLSEGKYLLLVTGVGSLCYLLCRSIILPNLLFTLLLRSTVCAVIAPGAYWLFLHNGSDYKQDIKWVLQSFLK